MQTLITEIKNRLSEYYSKGEASNITRIIIEYVLKKPLPLILIDKNTKISPSQSELIDKIVHRLFQKEPIQYVIGETEFFGLKFNVDKSVLIPRPETEELVEWIISDVSNNKEDLRLLDIGTGSGCIPISIKKNVSKSRIEAWDISHDALKTAHCNSNINNTNVTFKDVDILKSFPQENKFDIIVSNPPYILQSEEKEMEDNVLKYEPHIALFVPDNNPLIFYERIADIGQVLLKNKGTLYFEINSLCAIELTNLLISKGYKDIYLKKDISNKDRFIKASLY